MLNFYLFMRQISEGMLKSILPTKVPTLNTIEDDSALRYRFMAYVESATFKIIVPKLWKYEYLYL